MGIKNLNQFLKKYEVHETFHISNLTYTKLGIDTPMFLYKFKGTTNVNTNEWLGCFITFIAFLRKWDIHPIFVFEGKAPLEKAQTQEERREQRQKMVHKTNTIELDLNTYKFDGSITPFLSEVWNKLLLKQKTKNKSLLVKNVKVSLDTVAIEDEIENRRRYEISISSEDIANLKDLLDIMGVSWIQSIDEAETDCVSLFYSGAVDYIVSHDTDVLAYFSSQSEELKVINNFNTTELTFTHVSKQKVLDALNLTSESFRDFCIMCGTDYNKNIFRVGVETAYNFILKNFNIENVPLDTSILNHGRVREIFKVKENLEVNDKVMWCRLPKPKFVDDLAMFIFTHTIKNVDVNYIFECMNESEIDVEAEVV
jgi:5'-3' exonuclease